MIHYSWRKRLRTFLYIILALMLVLVGGAWYLIDYALMPGNRSRQEAQAWEEIDSLYPGMINWRDSLVQTNTLRDTMLTASDGCRLHAYYARASRPTAATALLVHGYTDCAVRIMPIGRMYFQELNMNILLPDLRNAGKSGGDHFQMGWLDREDVRLWAKTIPTLFGDSARTVVHGVSMGAATTMMLSGDSDVPHNVLVYIEDCGYTSVYDQFSKELSERFYIPRWPIMPIASTLCHWRYGWDFREASSLNQVKLCHKPMFFIHGTADKFVPTSMVYPLYQAKPSPKSIWLATGAEHARSYHKYPQIYTDKVRRFLKEYGILMKN